MDAPPLSLPARSAQLLNPRQRYGDLHLRAQRCRAPLCLLIPIRHGQSWLEDVHDERELGCVGGGVHLVLLGGNEGEELGGD